MPSIHLTLTSKFNLYFFILTYGTDFSIALNIKENVQV